MGWRGAKPEEGDKSRPHPNAVGRRDTIYIDEEEINAEQEFVDMRPERGYTFLDAIEIIGVAAEDIFGIIRDAIYYGFDIDDEIIDEEVLR